MNSAGQMVVGVTGYRGLIGGKVREAVLAGGGGVVGYSRSGGENGTRVFSTERVPDFSGVDAVVHMAGEPVLGVWTRAKRERILESRVLGTRRVVEGLARADCRILVCASAVGYYGDTGDAEVDESGAAGTGFLADVARAWEAEAVEAEKLGVRVVRLRIGFVLARGGAMRLIAPVFRAGLGGRLGNGRQWMSLVHVEDVVGMTLWAVRNPAISGALNAVMPRAVRNTDFTKELAGALGRPAIFPVPGPVLRLALGGLSELMLSSLRVRPTAALAGGYEFRHPSLPAALAASL